jgi:hypothetical protein
MSIRYGLQGMAQELAMVRRNFSRASLFNRGKRRDRLIEEMAYGVQNCLRALAMQFPPEDCFGATAGLKRAVAAHRANVASVGRNPKGGDKGTLGSVEDEHAVTPKAADAQDTAQ